MKSKSIVVVGSNNIDLVATSDKMPIPGESLIGTSFFMTPGGKGANQAVAAAKLGANVVLVARLGNDIFAEKSLESFRSAAVNTNHILQIDGVSSGIAMIIVDDEGRNMIVAIPGANNRLMPEDVEKAQADIAAAGVVVCQLEIPIETVEKTAELAMKYNALFLLDPAPVKPLSNRLLSMVDIIKPNEIEVLSITGIRVTDTSSAMKAADWFLAKGVKNIIITLGERGGLLANKESKEVFPGWKVKAVDSTAAGDTFTGALAYSLVNQKTLKDAVLYANAAAAISVQRIGAQSSMPTQAEVDTFLMQHS